MRALTLVLSLSLTGCMIEAPIVIEPPAPVPDAGPPVVVIPPKPDGGGGGGGPVVVLPPDAGPPDAGGPVMPGSGQGEDTGTGVLWLVRVEPGTANLAESYAALIGKMNAGLAAAGFSVRTTAVGSLYEPRLLWSRPDASTDGLAAVLQAEAQRATSTPSACSTQALANVGDHLASASAGSSVPFMLRRGALLVGVLDHAQRPVAYGAASCSYLNNAPADYFGGLPERAQWLNRSGGWSVPLLQTRFALVSTSETETADQHRTRCAALPGFSGAARPALDVIAPSSNPLYLPWAADLAQRQAGLARAFDLCDAVGTDFSSPAGGFARDWAQALRASPSPL